MKRKLLQQGEQLGSSLKVCSVALPRVSGLAVSGQKRMPRNDWAFTRPQPLPSFKRRFEARQPVSLGLLQS